MARNADDRLGASLRVCPLTQGYAQPLPYIGAAALGSVWLMTVLNFVFGIELAGSFAGTGLVIYFLCVLPTLPRVGWIVAVVAATAVYFSWPHVDAQEETLRKAFGTGCFFVAVLLSGGFLREAADRSAMIRRAGLALIQQPPTRRNAALSFGAFAMGFVLSFGSMQLLGSMVAKANTLEQAGGNATVQAHRLRRSTLAILRGFCMSSMCNPISIVMALALTYAPGAEFTDVLMIVFPSAVAFLVVGAVVDWIQGPRVTLAEGETVQTLAPMVPVLVLIAAVIGSVLLLADFAGLRIIDSVLVTVPGFAFVWMLIQHRGRGLIGRLEEHAVQRYPRLSVEVTILASAGVAGTILAAALPVEEIAEVVRSFNLPAVALPLAVFWFMVVGAQVAMNPILTASIAGAVLPAPLLMDTPPVVVAAAYMAAWGVGTSASPFTLSALVMAGISERKSTEIAWRWNGLFSITTLTLMSLILASAALLLDVPSALVQAAPVAAEGISWANDVLVFVGRLVATATLVITVARVSEQAGPFLASTILTLPLFAGPAYFFLMYEVSSSFLATSALIAFAGVGGVLAFTAGFIRAVQHVGLLMSLSGGALAWLVLALPVQFIEMNFAIAVGFCVAGIAVVWLARRPLDLHGRPKTGKSSWASLVLRSLVAGFAVACVAAVANAAGPVLTGLLVTFPLTLSVSVWMAYRQHGGEFAAAMLAATQRTLPTFCAFCVVLSLTAEVLPVPWGFVAAVTASLASAASLAFWGKWRADRTPAKA